MTIVIILCLGFMEKLMAEMYCNTPTFLCSLHVDNSPVTATTEEITDPENSQTTQSKHLTRYCSYSLTISNVLSHLYHPPDNYRGIYNYAIRAIGRKGFRGFR